MKVLKAGDFVDARDYRGKWYAAMIEWISRGGLGKIRVHFVGSRKRFDETITSDEGTNRIADLYTHSVDRRDWRIGEIVQYHYGDDTWLKVPIIDVDQTNSTIQFRLPQNEIVKCNLPHHLIDNLRWRSILSDNIAPYSAPTLKRSHDELTSTKPIKLENPPPAKAAKLTLPLPSVDVPDSWLVRLLRARGISEAHIRQCEDALVRDEGFINANLFRALPKSDFVACLKNIGITARGLQMQLVDLYMELQTDK